MHRQFKGLDKIYKKNTSTIVHYKKNFKQSKTQSQQQKHCSSIYLPALVMIISVPTSSNFVQSSLS